MSKEGMSEWEIRRHLSDKSPKEIEAYLLKLERKISILKPKTRELFHKVGHETFARKYEKEGDLPHAAQAYILSGAPRGEVYKKMGQIAENKFKDYLGASSFYNSMQTKEGHMLAAKALEKLPVLSFRVAELYFKAGMLEKAKDAYLKAAKYAVSKGYDKEAIAWTRKAAEISQGPDSTIDGVVASILAFGALGLIYSLFSKPAITAENVQLAPPFPNYMIYIFAAMLLGAAIYLTVKKMKK